MDEKGRPPPVRGRARGRVRDAAPVRPVPPPESVSGEQAPPPTAQIPSAQPPHVQPPPAQPPSAQPPSAQPPQAQPTPAPSTPTTTSALENLSIDKKVPQKPEDVPRKSRYTYMITRPESLAAKSTAARADEIPLNLVANYFQAIVPETWAIHQYAVDFDPPLEEDQTAQRKALFRTVATALPACLFDGLMLFTVTEISESLMSLQTTDKFTNKPVFIRISCHKVVDRKEPVCFQIYNIFVRKCLEHCKFLEMSRRYFDPAGKTTIAEHHLEIWPGFATSLRFFETQLLLNVEMVSKVVRTQTVLQVINDIRTNSRNSNEASSRAAIEQEIKSRIVLTPFNNRTYPIGEILWDERPTDHFPLRDGSTKSYVAYYKEKYGMDINDKNQPLLLVELKEREKRRGKLAPTVIKLVPETCVATGLTDSMRSNFRLMTAVGKVVHVEPTERVAGLQSFIKRFLTNEQIKEEISKWGISFDRHPIHVGGRKLADQKIYQGPKEFSYDQFSKGQNFREKLHAPLGITRWAALVPMAFEGDFMTFLKQMQDVSRKMNFNMGMPKIYKLQRTVGNEFLAKINDAVKDSKGELEMVFIVLPNNRADIYSLIKVDLTREHGLPSQCCLARNLKKGLSVATKVAVQMTCKVGGIPWVIRNPMKENICVMGFDVYHGGASSYGAIVATTDMELSKSCSFIAAHGHREEVSTTMGTQIAKCLQEYLRVNHVLPTRIFFYRDGVGEGQVDIVYDIELQAAKAAITKLYSLHNTEPPKLVYVIVSKRINSRFVVDKGNKRYENPPPGTVIDNTVTLHYRYDFFLVSQTARQGTVSPTNYNVILDDLGIPPFRLQLFTYRLCHNYYNWNGTLSVPSVCQNAHKLAYITGEAIKGGCKEDLRHLPYYL